MTGTGELARARAAARTYCEMHGYAGAGDALDGPPVLGPTSLTRDGHPVVAYRWLGAGRGADYVQVEVDADTGEITVHGARGHDAFPAWRSPVR